MTDLRQAAQMALKALELSAVTVDSFGVQKATQAAGAALRKALKQQQAEPVAWVFTPNNDLLWPHEVEVTNPIELNSYQPLYTTPPQQQAEPTQWRDMVVVSLVREGINKHKARELADHFAAQQ